MREPSDRELERLFALDDAGPARQINDARAASIVEAALRGAGFPPAGPHGGGGGGGGGGVARGVRRLGRGKLIAIAGGTLAVVATVALLAMRGGADEAPPVPAPVAAIAPTAIAAAPPTPMTAAVAPAPAVAAPARAADEPAAVAAPADEPATDEPAAAQPISPSPHRSRGPRHRAVHTTAAATPAAPATPAADLLAEANAARAHHQWRAADALYARVVAGGDASDALAAQTALVASATLHLEHLGDPRGASQRFHAALAAGGAGALAEDARWGLAEATGALGDTAGELRALDDFLAHHPSSALAPRARERRAALRGPP